MLHNSAHSAKEKADLSGAYDLDGEFVFANSPIINPRDTPYTRQPVSLRTFNTLYSVESLHRKAELRKSHCNPKNTAVSAAMVKISHSSRPTILQSL